MEVIITIQTSAGETAAVAASAGTYEQALAEAREKVPEGATQLSIRTGS